MDHKFNLQALFSNVVGVVHEELFVLNVKAMEQSRPLICEFLEPR